VAGMKNYHIQTLYDITTNQPHIVIDGCKQSVEASNMINSLMADNAKLQCWYTKGQLITAIYGFIGGFLVCLLF
jgi:hypothetical protein